jgi:hypothetical protein
MPISKSKNKRWRRRNRWRPRPAAIGHTIGCSRSSKGSDHVDINVPLAHHLRWLAWCMTNADKSCIICVDCRHNSRVETR